MSIPEDIKRAKKIARDQQLSNEKMIGRARAKTWGGKKSPQKSRKEVKRDLRNKNDIL